MDVTNSFKLCHFFRRKIMKKLLSILLIALLIFTVVACDSSKEPDNTQGSGDPSGTGGTVADGKVTLVLKNNVNPFWVRVEEGARQTATDMGVDLTVLAPMVNDSNEEQIQLVEQAIVSDSSVIIIAPADSQGILPAARQVHEEGIPLVDLNSFFAGDDIFWDTFVGLDNFEIGQITMAELCKIIGDEGEIIILEGVAGTESSYARINGAEDILKDKPNVKVVAKQAANWSRAEAMKVIQNLLPAHPNLKAIYAVNDEMALGALEALDMVDKVGKVFVSGVDANADAREAIREGRLAFSLDTNPEGQGSDAIKAAYDLLQGKKVEPMIITAVKIIDQSNIDE